VLGLADEVDTASGRSAQYPRLAELEQLELEQRPRPRVRPLNFQVVDWEAEKRATHSLLHSDAAVWLAAKAIAALLLTRFVLQLIEGDTQTRAGHLIDLLSSPLMGPLDGSSARVDFMPLIALLGWLLITFALSRVITAKSRSRNARAANRRS